MFQREGSTLRSVGSDIHRSRTLLVAVIGLTLFYSAAAVPAAIVTVDNSENDGEASLRAVVAAAAPGDTVTFATGATISLTRGDLVIDKDLKIHGPSDRNLILFGASVVVARGAVVLSNLTISSGRPGVANGGTLTMRGCRIIGSAGTAIINEDTLDLEDCEISNNSREASPGPGAIFNLGYLTLTRTRVVNNSTFGTAFPFPHNCGAIYNGGKLTLIQSDVSGNRVSGAGVGGICNAGIGVVIESTLSNNSAGPGNSVGGARNDGFLQFVNSTITGNKGDDSGGVESSGDLELIFTTVAANQAGSGGTGGIAVAPSPGRGTAVLRNTLVALNQPFNCAGTVRAGGYSLSDDTTCAGAVTATVGLADELADNGGLTATLALLPGSPAVDAVPADACTGADLPLPTTDQRGAPRPSRGACDAGSFESTCGDAVLDSAFGESCDDGNALETDGCSSACAIVPTPTPTATMTATPTATDTPTATPTSTATETPTYTASVTPTETSTETPTATATETPTETPTQTPTCTPTDTATDTPTASPTETATPSETPTATQTATDTPSATQTETATQTTTSTPTHSPTETPSETPTETPVATETPTTPPTPLPTARPTPACLGDCGQDGRVTVEEIVTLVKVALGTAPAASCANGISDDNVTVDEIVSAVNNALNGCT